MWDFYWRFHSIHSHSLAVSCDYVQLFFIGDTVETAKKSKDDSKPKEVVKNTYSMYLPYFVQKYSN